MNLVFDVINDYVNYIVMGLVGLSLLFLQVKIWRGRYWSGLQI